MEDRKEERKTERGREDRKGKGGQKGEGRTERGRERRKGERKRSTGGLEDRKGGGREGRGKTRRTRWRAGGGRRDAREGQEPPRFPPPGHTRDPSPSPNVPTPTLGPHVPTGGWREAARPRGGEAPPELVKRRGRGRVFLLPPPAPGFYLGPEEETASSAFASNPATAVAPSARLREAHAVG